MPFDMSYKIESLQKILFRPTLDQVHTQSRSKEAEKKCGHESDLIAELPAGISSSR